MKDSLHDYLLARPSGATPRELLDLVFTGRGSDPEFGVRFLANLFAGDERFLFDGERGRWRAAAHRHLSQTLAEASFVVVDLETTGGGPERGDSIIEIGAVRVSGGNVVDTFQSLIDPGRRLPPFITRLTGIDDAMLAGQPPIADILPQFARFAADAVLVAHNARFDRAFLDAAWRIVLGQPVASHFLCTLRLARRLLPALRKRSLDALAAHFGILSVDRHRALGDARITAEVLFHMLDLLPQRGVVHLGEALDFQEAATDGRRFFCALPRAAVTALPRRPGVYRLRGADGRLLYVGKAVDVQRRVASYLTNSRGHSRKTLDLIRHIRTVDCEETGSDLEASLREAELIRCHQPPYNVLRKHLPQIAWLKLSVTDAHPRLSIASRLSRGRARHFGPFRSRTHARRALDTLIRIFLVRTCTGRLQPAADFSPCLQGQIGNCSRPCTGAVDRDGYAEQVARLLAFIDGEADTVFDELQRRRDALSDDLRFEAAARVQADIDCARHLRARQNEMGWIVEQQHFLVLQPSIDARTRLYFAVVHGRLVERGTLASETDIRPLTARIAEHLQRPARRGGLAPEEVDGTTILAAWLRDRTNSDGYVLPITHAGGAPNPPHGHEPERLPDWAAALPSLLTAAPQGDARG